MDSKAKPLDVVIIGGSLAGLMCGVALKHRGHNITILERDGDERQSHMAGVCLGPDAVRYLELHDRLSSKPFSHRSTRVQALRSNGTIDILANGRREITSWDTYYFRLRSLFDGYSSSYYPEPPESLSTADGTARYLSRNMVTNIERDIATDKMAITVLNPNTQKTSTHQADLVIGADGPNSFVRSKYLPTIHRQYAGYIAWRGTVLESTVSPSTRNAFRRSVSVHMMLGHTGQQEHCIVYAIPGPDGSLAPGERYLNFLWYTNETPAALDEILLDGIDGHRHHNIVPSGRVRKDLWEGKVHEAREIPLPEAFLEVVTKIEKPFVQVITEFYAPEAVFEGGRVLLVGDALCLFRPHTAFSGTQAAFHALRVEEYVAGEIGLGEWEGRVLRYSWLHWMQSIWWGAYYQCKLPVAAAAAVRYWVYCGVESVRCWWRGEEGLLRTGTFAVERYEDE
ncbi:hypothetical protein QBC40DRAFT_326093 [Triangularia verruculosa]|uniref:FAD/NAD(P)-binding domain-containing protein n=1 Tax=Triangularia verruculosa TaxID=2587418 RepID=A0AAN6XHI6_9PEZI|nr:hypothetical protein QBC40DRAFT_326093 [Triangularia verruculosa]